jgi:hypothetical protein
VRWYLTTTRCRGLSVNEVIAATETKDDSQEEQLHAIDRKASDGKHSCCSRCWFGVWRENERPVPYTRRMSSSTKFLWPKACVAFATLAGLEDAMENTFFRLTEESRHLS